MYSAITSSLGFSSISYFRWVSLQGFPVFVLKSDTFTNIDYFLAKLYYKDGFVFLEKCVPLGVAGWFDYNLIRKLAGQAELACGDASVFDLRNKGHFFVLIACSLDICSLRSQWWANEIINWSHTHVFGLVEWETWVSLYPGPEWQLGNRSRSSIRRRGCHGETNYCIISL